jgi:hypothetical protein
LASLLFDDFCSPNIGKHSVITRNMYAKGQCYTRIPNSFEYLIKKTQTSWLT